MDNVWFEEYADPQKDPIATPRVLNGNVFAIDGLFWFWYLTKEDEYKFLLENSIRAVDKYIHLYDSGVWSYYDIRSNLAHAGYHKLHIKQLNRLSIYSEIIGLDSPKNIHRYLKKYRVYRASPFLGYAQRMVVQRNNMVYAIFVSNFLAIFLMAVFLVRGRIFRRDNAC